MHHVREGLRLNIIYLLSKLIRFNIIASIDVMLFTLYISGLSQWFPTTDTSVLITSPIFMRSYGANLAPLPIPYMVMFIIQTYRDVYAYHKTITVKCDIDGAGVRTLSDGVVLCDNTWQLQSSSLHNVQWPLRLERIISQGRGWKGR